MPWVFALLVLLLAPLLPAQQKTFHDDFEHGMKNWLPPRASDWKIAEENGNHFLRLKSVYPPGVPRRPLNFALRRDACFSDFTMSVRLRQRNRSLIIVFDYQDTLHFNYAHLSVEPGTKTLVHNGIFGVDGTPRVRLDDPNRPPALPDQNWHIVKIVRQGNSVRVYMDGSSEPLLETSKGLFPYGQIGIGSFDEIGDFDDLEISGTPCR